MGKYLFIANGSKQGIEESLSKSKFELSNYIKVPAEIAKESGYEVYIGINKKYPELIECSMDVKFYNANIFRNIFDIKNNLIAYKNLMNILKSEKIDVIHCNTPIGGVLGRLCGRKLNVPKIIYTAHGFHFYKGAPLLNQTLFKWIEMWMAHYTDALITINQEDYQSAQKFKLRKEGKVYYVPGVGIDTSIISKKKSKRKDLLNEIKAGNDSILMISVGDLNKNKNNEVIIKALGQVENTSVHYILCGLGDEKDKLISLAKENNCEKNIHFLGYRSDIPELLQSCDIFVMPSYREGLSRSIMEAMSAGLPCVVSKIRGNVDLIKDGKGGYVCQPDNIQEFARAISVLISDSSLRSLMGKYNLKNVRKYDVEQIKLEIKKIYNEIL